MHLTVQDLKILSISEQSANISARALASEHDLPDYTIRYALNSFKNVGLIQWSTAVINYSRHPNRQFSFCFSPENRSLSKETASQRIATFCAEHSLSLLSCYGTYQYYLGGSASSLTDIRKILSEVSNTLDESFSKQGFYLRLDSAYLQRGYLRPEPFERSVIRVPFSETPPILDNKEERILNHLSTVEVSSIKDLSIEIDCSMPAARAKVSKLEEMGVICGYMHVLNPWLLGRLPAVLLITTDTGKFAKVRSG
jgi:DNA-binding Lrp family transcriptional regulator